MNALQKVMPLWLSSTIKVVLLDLWKTIARGPYPEPIADLMKILGLEGKVDAEQFLRVCLTTQHEDPELYMLAVAGHFGVEKLPENALAEFQGLIRREKNGLLVYGEVHKVIRALKQHGLRVGLVTNSWPFPVRALLKSTGLDELFDHVISSSEVGLAKQDGPEIYFLAAQIFNVRPEECVMVGDNPSLDYYPALAANARAVLIDRDESCVDENGQFRSPRLADLNPVVIRNLYGLPPALGLPAVSESEEESTSTSL
jgi:HAD superfamily hydrolase (TIGR01509 family)